MSFQHAILADGSPQRAQQIKEALQAAGTICHSIGHEQEISKLTYQPDILLVASDLPPFHVSEDILRAFIDLTPQAPIVLLTSEPLWRLITIAIRERIWVDIPKSPDYTNLLQRYTQARMAPPTFIIDSELELFHELQDAWQLQAFERVPLLASSVGEALEVAVGSRQPIFLNRPASLLPSYKISTLIYKLCPVAVGVLIRMHTPTRPLQNFYLTDPISRFAVMIPPFTPSNIRMLFADLDANWPGTLPMSPSPTQSSPASFR